MLKSYLDNINFNSLVASLTEYSGQEIGIRHPNGPVGVVCRDQGTLDLYSGKSRLLLDVKGLLSAIGNTFNAFVNEFNINTPEISNVIIAGYKFNNEIANKEFIIKNQDLSQFMVVTPNTYVINDDGTKGFLANTTSMSEIFDTQRLFIDTITRYTRSSQEEFEDNLKGQLYGH